jgi:hypothetical protein
MDFSVDCFQILVSNQINYLRTKEVFNRAVTYQPALAKGQLISKCPFGVIASTKIPTKKFDNFCPRILKSGEINKIKAVSYNTVIYI